jgi:hypothetical protein
MSKNYTIARVGRNFVVRVRGVKLGTANTRLGALIIAVRHQESGKS